MKPTHKEKISDSVATAWQFSRTNSIPVWVARSFHRVGSEGWSAIAMDDVLVEAKEGDWAVAINDEIVIVLTDVEFHKLFEPIKPVAETNLPSGNTKEK